MLLRNGLVVWGALVLVQVANAGVSRLSFEQSVVDVQGVSAAQVIVWCSNSKESRTIVKKDGERQWCDSQLTTLCSSQKLKVAKKVCNSSYKERLSGAAETTPDQTVGGVNKAKEKVAVAKSAPRASAKKVDKEDLAAARAQLLNIEQQRVKIQQRQLELRKLELELERQRVADVESGS